MCDHKTRMNSGLLCWRKPMPSKDSVCLRNDFSLCSGDVNKRRTHLPVSGFAVPTLTWQQELLLRPWWTSQAESTSTSDCLNLLRICGSWCAELENLEYWCAVVQIKGWVKLIILFISNKNFLSLWHFDKITPLAASESEQTPILITTCLPVGHNFFSKLVLSCLRCFYSVTWTGSTITWKLPNRGLTCPGMIEDLILFIPDTWNCMKHFKQISWKRNSNVSLLL